MLVLSRRKNESIEIAGGLIKLTVVDIRGDKVRFGIEAPKDIEVHRSEVQRAIERNERRQAQAAIQATVQGSD